MTMAHCQQTKVTKRQPHKDALDWKRKCKDGSTLGLLLDMDEGFLAVYTDAKTAGLSSSSTTDMVRCGMMVPQKLLTFDIVGPLRWVVDVAEGSTATIVRKSPPDVPASVVAAEVEKWKEGGVDGWRAKAKRVEEKHLPRQDDSDDDIDRHASRLLKK